MPDERPVASGGGIIEGVHVKRRLQQMMFAVASGLGVLIVSNLIFGASAITTSVLAATQLIVALCYVLLRSGHPLLSAYILMWSGTLVCLGLVSSNYGLRDTSLLAFPAILFFAAVLGNRGLFYSLYAFQLIMLSLIGFADLFGWWEFPKRDLAPDNIVDVLVLLGFVGFCMRFLSNDLRNVTGDLKREALRAREAETEAHHRAYHDDLTGLANRFLAEERFNQAIQNARRKHTKVALLFLDLDYFKTFNDSLGHSVGDELICAVGRRLQGAVRGNDVVSRLGGDEFIVIMTDLDESQAARRCAMKLLQVISEPMELAQRSLVVSASIGLAIGPDDGDSFDDLSGKADMAMYRAKETGRNTFKFYDEQLNHEALARMQLVAGLQQAVREQEFLLHYQPLIDLASGRVLGAEALVRWQRPEHGLVSPCDFIAAAEETSLILKIGRWVMREACRECKRWHARGYTDLSISVNVSPMQLTREDFEDSVLNVLEETGLPARYLELELIESLLINSDPVLDSALANLQARGIRFAIDDFGTGYSNLSYLSRFNAQRLKIDRSFVSDSLGDSKENTPIVTAIVQLGHGLGMQVVAEGIEDEGSLERMSELGCDIGQGYVWSRPVSGEDFLAYVEAGRSPGQS